MVEGDEGDMCVSETPQQQLVEICRPIFCGVINWEWRNNFRMTKATFQHFLQ